MQAGGILTPPLSGQQLGQLVGRGRVDLTPGASRGVSVRFPVSSLAVTPGDIDPSGPPKVMPGNYQLTRWTFRTVLLTWQDRALSWDRALRVAMMARMQEGVRFTCRVSAAPAT